MTTPIEESQWCGECENEYMGYSNDDCPICPLREIYRKSWSALYPFEKFQYMIDDDASGLEAQMNAAVAEGWDLVPNSLRVIALQTEGETSAVEYSAVFERSEYDRADHAVGWEASKKRHRDLRDKIHLEAAKVREHRSKIEGEG